MYHYYFPGVPHVLFSPSGVFVFVTRFQAGGVTWDEQKQRIAHTGGNLFRTIFGQEGMGNPVAELEVQTKAIERFLQKHLTEDEIPEIHGAVVFLNDEIELKNPDVAPITLIRAKDLKDFMRKLPKNLPMTIEQIDKLEEAIGLE